MVHNADVCELAVAYISTHGECNIFAAMCVLSKLKSVCSHAPHQTCLRPGRLLHAEQVRALVNIYSSMVTIQCLKLYILSSTWLLENTKVDRGSNLTMSCDKVCFFSQNITPPVDCSCKAGIKVLFTTCMVNLYSKEKQQGNN